MALPAVSRTAPKARFRWIIWPYWIVKKEASVTVTVLPEKLAVALALICVCVAVFTILILPILTEPMSSL